LVSIPALAAAAAAAAVTRRGEASHPRSLSEQQRRATARGTTLALRHTAVDGDGRTLAAYAAICTRRAGRAAAAGGGGAATSTGPRQLSDWARVGALLTLLALPVDFNNDRLPPPLTAATSDLELWPVATLVNDPRMPMARSLA
ncbi:unnamed protein product, partial [Ectocarpus sp. 12 AP-2014]